MMKFKKMEVIGKVIFLKSKKKKGEASCRCCKDYKKGQYHIFGEYIKVPVRKSKYTYSDIEDVADYIQDFIHDNMFEIEGKKVRITCEVLE